MKPISKIMEYLALAALPGVLVLNPMVASADDSKPPTTASRPAKTPTDQTSVPNNSPPASPMSRGRNGRNSRRQRSCSSLYKWRGRKLDDER